jgi:cytochrome b561
MVLLIAFEVPIGFLMAATYGAAFRDPQVRVIHVLLAQIHYTIGFSLLLLVAVRLLWRVRHPVPMLPRVQAAYQRWLARGNHWAFYLLLILIPLSGWSAISVLGNTERFGDAPIWLFGWNIVPPILPQRPLEDPFGYGFVASIHRYAIYVGGALLALHVLAALFHHLVRRDGILLRMWPGTSGDAQD